MFSASQCSNKKLTYLKLDTAIRYMSDIQNYNTEYSVLSLLSVKRGGQVNKKLEVEYRDGTQMKADKILMGCTHNRVIHTMHIYEFPAQVNQAHKPYIYCRTTWSLNVLYYNTKLTTLSACT